MLSQNQSLLTRILRLIARLEDGVLVALLACMIVLAGVQIVLRNFGSGYVYADPALRVLVLWVGLFGAIVASRDAKHISIDILTRLLSARAKIIATIVINLFVALVCVLITYHAIRFIGLDYDSNTIAFAGIPAWVVELILPIAFGVIGLRYFLFFVSAVRKLVWGTQTS